MDKLIVGMHVEIMRSDGRVHGAIITELKHPTKSISVEWFEKGETKGKELDLNSLVKNNPRIFQSDQLDKNTSILGLQKPTQNSRTRHTTANLDTSLNNKSKHDHLNAAAQLRHTKREEKLHKTNVHVAGKTGQETAPKINRQKVADKQLKITNIVKYHGDQTILDKTEQEQQEKEPMLPIKEQKLLSHSMASIQNEEAIEKLLPPTQIDEIDKICKGMNINIERSDGRVHGAMVTHVNPATKMISVEWFENGETKGKDMDLRVIVRNNQQLFRPLMPPTLSSLSTSTSRNSLNGYQTSRMASNQHSANGVSSIQTQQQQQYNPHSSQQQQISPSAAGVGSIHSIMDITYTTDEIEENFYSKDQPITRDRRRTHNVEKSSSNSGSMAVVRKKKQVDVTPLSDISEDNLLDGSLAPDFPLLNDVKDNESTEMPQPHQPSLQQERKSILLSNIEELERNREQRRVQQGQARKQRELQMQIDPGNPNWEFLSMIREYQAQLNYRPLRMTDRIVDNRICVCVRKRPLSKKESLNKEVEVVTIPNKDHVIIHQPQVKVDLTKYLVNQKFRFDYTFNESADNDLVYKFSAQPLVRTIFQRGFATCFAYGQTGSGKTHTMGGIIEGRRQDCTNGIYAMTAHDVFALLHSPEYRNEGLIVSCSFFEIYGTKVFDLLYQKAVLRVLEDGKHLVQVVGLKEIQVQNVEDVLKQIKIGSNQRTAGQTSANSNSSRSHAVFQIILRKRDKCSELYGKFSLIDLAGNERGADTISSDRQTRLEGAEINKSLLALKECIRAMGRDEQHIPFRGSKLTLILRDSFVGRNAKTCMIAMISPGISCVENTMNTLRYADRVKELGSDRDDPERYSDDGMGSYLITADSSGM